MSPLQSGNGLGVPSIRERMQLVGGKLSISSKPGKGTKILAEVPFAGE